jgi:hypothetical protein
MRRLTLTKRDSASSPLSSGTPTWRAASSAAQALARLCSPESCHWLRPISPSGPCQNQFAAGVVAADPVACLAIEALDWRPATALQYAFQAGFVCIADDQAGGGQGAHQVVKLCFDRSKIAENVCMIEFKIVQNSSARAVMNELGALVTEGGVVFVGFDDEERCVAEAGRNAKIKRHAANQEAGRHVGVFEYPGQHRTGCRLAVRAGDAEYPAALKYVFGQPLRAGNIGKPWSRMASSNGLPREMALPITKTSGLSASCSSPKSFDQINAGAAQLVAHWRINVGVAAGDLVAGSNCQLGDAAHEGAADTQNMNVHVT